MTDPTPTPAPVDLAELWRIARATTRGPWVHEVGEGQHIVRPEPRGDGPKPYPVAHLRLDNIGHCDAEFIATMRNALPWLLDRAAAVARVEALEPRDPATATHDAEYFRREGYNAALDDVRAALDGSGVAE